MNIFQTLWELIFKRKPNAERPVSQDMQTALEKWRTMYEIKTGDHQLELPAGISSEFARLMLAESEISVEEENPRAEFIGEQMQNFFESFAEKAEAACALGSMAFKPYVSGGKIIVDMVRADRYMPTVFDADGNVTAAVFMARKNVGKVYYTRLEFHNWDADGKKYTVDNECYRSIGVDTLGTPCSLSDVDGWEMLQGHQEIKNITAPLFAVFRVPYYNRIDMDSAVGVSVFANAVGLIDQANEIWRKIQWEYDATEAAVDASMDIFDNPRAKQKNKKLGLPRNKDRLFRKFDFGTESDITKIMQIYSPAIRDTSYFNGFNHILQRIEFNVGLAYGTISEPQEMEKTAEEIRTSKQRSFVHVAAMQKALEAALNDLAYAMDVYTTLYQLAPAGECTLSCNWGDSVLEDADKEFQRRLQMCNARILKPEYVVSYALGITPEKALEDYIPDQADDGGLFSGGVI